MELEWDRVKEWTLWHYEDLIKRIRKVFEYAFVQENYNLSMGEARRHSAKLLTYGECKHNEYLMKLSETFLALEKSDISNYIDLLGQVSTREKCEDFVMQTGLQFRELIRLLNHLFRWVLPFQAPIKEFIDKDDAEQLECAMKLMKFGIKNNLDLLEIAHTKTGRDGISKQTGLDSKFVIDLFHRSDISRIPYIRGKTVKIFFGAGYDSLRKIAEADEETFVSDLNEYLQSVGMKFSKSFIEPDGAIAQAKVLPPLFET